MADTISSDRRSKIMSHIKSKDTSIEMMVRRRLFAMGYYWHGHDCGSRYAHTSQSNKAYWGPKIEWTKQRDQQHIRELETLGWKVVVLWECQLKNEFDAAFDYLKYCIDA